MLHELWHLEEGSTYYELSLCTKEIDNSPVG